MKAKIFIVCEPSDTCVAPLAHIRGQTGVQDYVDILGELYQPENLILGDHDDTELLLTSQDLILEKLEYEFRDARTNIILISPNMLDPDKSQMHQWPPWEIYYLVNQTPRNKTMAITIPNERRSCDYTRFERRQRLPEILYRNVEAGLIPTTTFENFMKAPDDYMRRALIAAKSTPEYRIRKTILPE